MKILSLNFTNLNSLKGSWHIDFSDDAFVRDGIFAIIGQTGAGKTTILDAICLAIYGQTPRIKQISASHNELMSLGTGECAAQVEIALGGKCYRFSWQQRRAGGKADGKLQAIRREISQIKHQGDTDGEILETKLSLCDKKAIQIMHMNFEQFTRSVMLAQGNFAAFLKADAGEKGEILEQITGTEIYAKISAKAFDTEKQKRLALAALQDKLADHAVMSDDEFHALTKSVKDDESTLATLQNTLSATEQIIKKLEQKQQHEKSISDLTTALAQHEQAFADFRPNLVILDNANKAFELQSDYTALSHLNAQKNQYQNEQNRLNSTLDSTKTELANSQAQQAKAHHDLTTIKAKYEQTLPIFRQVRELDGQISHNHEQYLKIQSTYDKYTKELQNIAQDLDNSTQAKVRTEHQLGELASKIQPRPSDDGQQIGLLTAHQGTLAQQIKQLANLRQAVSDTHTHINTLNDDLDQKRLDYRQFKKENIHHNNELAEFQAQFATLTGSSNDVNADNLTNFGMTLSQDIHACTQLKSVLDALLSTLDEQQNNQDEIAAYQQKIDNLTAHSEQFSIKINELHEKITQQQNTLTALERTATLQSDIAILQKHLSELTDGTPCPLCGSTNHPYKDNHAQSDLDKDTADSTNNAIAHTKQSIKTLENEYQDALKAQIINDNNLENLNNNLQTLQAKIPTLDQKIFALSAQITPLCQQLALSVGDIGRDTVLILANQCEQKHAQLHAQMSEYQQLEPKIKGTQTLINQTKEQCQAIHQAGDLLKNQIASLKDSLDKQQADLNHLCLSTQDNLGNIIAIICQFDNTDTPSHHQNLLDILQNISAIDGELISQLSTLNDDILEKVNNISQNYQAHQHYITQKQQLEQELHGIIIHIDHEHKKQQTLQQNSQDTHQQIQEIALKINELKQIRIDLFGDKNTDEQEQLIRQQLDDAQRLAHTTDQTLNQHQHALSSLQERLAALGDDLARLDDDITKQSADFMAALADKGFNGEQQFLAARIDNAERLALSEQADALRYAIKKTADSLAQEQQQLSTLAANINTNDSLDELYERKETTQLQERTLLQNLGKNQQILVNARSERDKHTALAEQIREKKQDIEIWTKLNELIGSADGKKYRNFVQGLTLDMMLYHANEVLARMSERYILCHSDDDKLLEINIIDTHQGNEERSTKNLSGGESFIVSLALALGLSKMSSENISIDSLFLDEGFGTLDEEILDTALATLAALQDEGKMIGIISHVASLKERIGTQIIVHKGANGTSKLSGTGVKNGNQTGSS